MSRYEDDANVAAVFARADKSMYENKSALKSGDLPESALGAPSPS
jgi:hypothetical protein